MAELNVQAGKTNSRRRVKKMPPKVDLTAMVDLAFLLITFFMLTTSLIKPRVMPLAMPDRDNARQSVSEKTTLTLVLGSHNSILWYLGTPEKPLTAPSITTYGKNLNHTILGISKKVFKKEGKELMVLIKPANHSIYANLVEALDEVNNDDINRYAIVTIAKSDVINLQKFGIN